MFGVKKVGDQVTVTVQMGRVATKKIDPQVVADDPGPWDSSRIQKNYSFRRASIRTDVEEYVLSAFIPKARRQLTRRRSEENGSVVPVVGRLMTSETGDGLSTPGSSLVGVSEAADAVLARQAQPQQDWETLFGVDEAQDDVAPAVAAGSEAGAAQQASVAQESGAAQSASVEQAGTTTSPPPDEAPPSPSAMGANAE